MAAFWAFQFSEQGAIAYADDLIEKRKITELYDYLPGTIDSIRSDKGYVSVPWQWYR